MATTRIALSVFAALAASVSSQSPTVNVGPPSPVQVQTIITGLASASREGVAASVVSADACRTTLAMQCSDPNICAAAQKLQINVTQGGKFYEVVYSSSTFGGSFEASQLCTLRPRHSCMPESQLTGPTREASYQACLSGTEADYVMACSMKATVVVRGSTIASNTELTGLHNYHYAQIPITAGAEKLPPTGATCAPTAWPTANTTDRLVYGDYTTSSEPQSLVTPSLGTRQIVIGGVVLLFAHLAKVI